MKDITLFHFGYGIALMPVGPFKDYEIETSSAVVIRNKIDTIVDFKNQYLTSCEIPKITPSKYNFWWEEERNRYTSDPYDSSKFNSLDNDKYIIYNFDTEKDLKKVNPRNVFSNKNWQVNQARYNSYSGPKFWYRIKDEKSYSKLYKIPLTNLNYNKLFKQGIWNDIPRFVETKKDYATRCYGYPFLDREWHIDLNIKIDHTHNFEWKDGTGYNNTIYSLNHIKWNFTHKEKVKNIKNNFDKMPINHCSFEPVINTINEKGLADFKNWRIPSDKELEKVITNEYPMLDSKYFPEVTQYKEDFEKNILTTQSFYENEFDSLGYKIYENKKVLLPIFRKGIIIMVTDIEEKN